MCEPTKSWQEVTPSYNTIKQYVTILSYKIIGDDATHSKYVNKLASQGNVEALADLRVEKQVLDALALIQKLLDELSALGYKRISAVCRSVVDSAEAAFPRVILYTLCCLTGECIHEGIELRIDRQFFNLDSKYKQFIYSLWLCKHMRQVENARVGAWNCAENVRTVSDAICAYLQSEEAPGEQEITVYVNAFATVLSSLSDTLDYVKRFEAAYLQLAQEAEQKNL